MYSTNGNLEPFYGLARNSLVFLVFLLFFSSTSRADEGYKCPTTFQGDEVFKCDVIKAFDLTTDDKIISHEEVLNGKIDILNNKEIIFTPNSGFVGSEVVKLTVSSGGAEIPKELPIHYSSVKQSLLAPGQITAMGTLLLLVLTLSIVAEFALRHIFQWRWFIILLEGRGFKFLIGFVVAFLLVKAVNVDLVAGFSSIINSNTQPSGNLGMTLTALIIAGGSATVLQLWKMFKFLPDPGIGETAVKKRNFSRVKILVDREPLDKDQKKEPLEVYIDGDLIGAIESTGCQYPPINFLWSGYPVEAKEHIYEVVYRAGTASELRWCRRHGVPNLNITSSRLHFKLDPDEVTFIQSGDINVLIAPYELKSGDPFKVGSIIAIAMTNAAADEAVKGAVTGVFNVPKATGTTFAQGDKLYWDDTNKHFTKTASGNTLAAVALAAAPADAEFTRVRLTA